MHLPPRWVVAVSLAVAAAILGDSLLYAVLPIVWPQLGLEVGMVGVLLSANRFVRLVSNPLAGWVIARLGVRRPFVLAVFLGAGTTAAYALGLGFPALLAARAAWGVCWSFLRLGGYLAALEAASPRRRGYYLAFFNGVTRFGSFAAVLLGGLLTDLLGFVATVALFTGLNLAGGLALLRERPPRPPAGAAANTPHPPAPDEPAGAGMATPARPPRLRLATVYAAAFLHGLTVAGLVQATLGRWLLLLYGPTAHLALLTVGVATLTGWLLSVRFLADFLWGPLAGHLSDRHGRRVFTLAAGAVEIGALVWLAAAGSLAATLLAAVLLFLAGTTLQATLDATAGDLAPPARRSRVLAWYTNWSDLGAATGPLVGYLIGAGAGLDALYRGAAGLLALVGLLYLATFAAPDRPRPAAG